MLSPSQIKNLAPDKLCEQFEVPRGEFDGLAAVCPDEDLQRCIILLHQEIISDFSVEPEALPSLVQIYHFDRFFVGGQIRARESYLDQASTRFKEAHQLHVNFCAREEMDSPTPESTARFVAGLVEKQALNTFAALKNFLNGKGVVSNTEALDADSVPYNEVSDVLPNAEAQGKALAIVGRLPEDLRSRLGLSKSSLASAITVLKISEAEIHDMDHLRGKGIAPVTYLALRSAGIEHSAITVGADFAENLEGQGTDDSDFFIRELVNYSLLDPNEIATVSEGINTVAFETLMKFAEYFGFDDLDLSDESSRLVEALASLRSVEGLRDSPLDDLLPKIIQLAALSSQRDFNSVFERLESDNAEHGSTSRDRGELDSDEEEDDTDEN